MQWLNFAHGIFSDMNTKLIRHLQKRGCRDTAVPPGFECEITDKGIIIKKFTGLNPNPRIESEYGGVPVIAISEEAFKNNRNIETVNIPEGITEIGEMVFGDCNRLTSITIPDSVTKIGIYAFGDCESLVTIDIPDSITEIGHDAFFGCKSLTSIVIPEGVTIIAHLVFAHCTSLTSVTIPDSVTKISADAFLNCPNLTGRQRLNTGQDEKNTVHYSSIRSEHAFRMAFFIFT